MKKFSLGKKSPSEMGNGARSQFRVSNRAYGAASTSDETGDIFRSVLSRRALEQNWIQIYGKILGPKKRESRQGKGIYGRVEKRENDPLGRERKRGRSVVGTSPLQVGLFSLFDDQQFSRSEA